MTEPTRDFSKEAATWDDKPGRVKVAHAIAEAIIGAVPITPDMTALDFGCGTGLLTLRLQPLVRSIVGVDSSPGMLSVLEQKVSQQRLTNVCWQCIDFEQGNMPRGRFTLITSAMTLHHVREVEPLLAWFFQALAPGGLLCLADLDTEDGLFHEDNTGVFHFGFDRAWLEQRLTAAGFTGVQAMTATEIEKPAADGVLRRFPVFLLHAQKP